MIERNVGFLRLAWNTALFSAWDGRHPMLFAGYQTNPNYLGTCCGFFERGALLAHPVGVTDTEPFADEREPRFSNSHHFQLIPPFNKLRPVLTSSASFFLARSEYCI